MAKRTKTAWLHTYGATNHLLSGEILCNDTRRDDLVHFNEHTCTTSKNGRYPSCTFGFDATLRDLGVLPGSFCFFLPLCPYFPLYFPDLFFFFFCFLFFFCRFHDNLFVRVCSASSLVFFFGRHIRRRGYRDSVELPVLILFYVPLFTMQYVLHVFTVNGSPFCTYPVNNGLHGGFISSCETFGDSLYFYYFELI
jgi:hypothetical protein